MIIVVAFMIYILSMIFLVVWTFFQMKKDHISAIMHAKTIQKMTQLINIYTEPDSYATFQKYSVCTSMIEHMIYVYEKIMKYGDFTLERVVVSEKKPSWFSEERFLDEIRLMSQSDDYRSIEIICEYGNITSMIIKVSRPSAYYIDRVKYIGCKIHGYWIKVFKHTPIPNIQEIFLSKRRPFYFAFSD